MKFLKLTFSILLIATIVFSLTSTVKAGAGYREDLYFLLTEPHSICGKTYQATAEQIQVVDDYLYNSDNSWTDAQYQSCIDKINSALNLINSTGASSISDVPMDVQQQAISLVQSAGKDIDLNVSVNTASNMVIVSTAKTGQTLLATSYQVVNGQLETVSSVAQSPSKLASIAMTGTDGSVNCLEGNGQLYNVNSCTNLVFRFDSDYSYFVNGGKVYLDGKELSSSCYTSKSGSTIISVNYDFAKTIPEGNHTLKVAFTNGTEGEASFKVTKVDVVTSGSTATTTGTASGSTVAGSAFVYTGSNNVAYVLLALSSVVAVSVVFVRKIHA